MKKIKINKKARMPFFFEIKGKKKKKSNGRLKRIHPIKGAVSMGS